MSSASRAVTTVGQPGLCRLPLCGTGSEEHRPLGELGRHPYQQVPGAAAGRPARPGPGGQHRRRTPQCGQMRGCVALPRRPRPDRPAEPSSGVGEQVLRRPRHPRRPSPDGRRSPTAVRAGGAGPCAGGAGTVRNVARPSTAAGRPDRVPADTRTSVIASSLPNPGSLSNVCTARWTRRYDPAPTAADTRPGNGRRPWSNGPVHPATDKVARALAAAGATGTVRELDSSARTAALAAAQLGVDVGAIANSLVFSADDRPLLVLTSGAHRVDTALSARTLGVGRLDRADPDFVRTHTGQAIGGVAPVGHPAPIQTLVDTAARPIPGGLGRRGPPQHGVPDDLRGVGPDHRRHAHGSRLRWLNRTAGSAMRAGSRSCCGIWIRPSSGRGSASCSTSTSRPCATRRAPGRPGPCSGRSTAAGRASTACRRRRRPGTLHGLAYGYRGLPGQWWHGEVLPGPRLRR